MCSQFPCLSSRPKNIATEANKPVLAQLHPDLCVANTRNLRRNEKRVSHRLAIISMVRVLHSLKFDNLPISEGTVPDIGLLERLRNESDVIVPISVEIVPEIAFPAKLSIVKAVSANKSVGMVPLSLKESKSNSVREVQSPISVGMDPPIPAELPKENSTSTICLKCDC